MKINVGDYVRTPKGIGKITNIYTGYNKQEDSGFCIDSCKEKFYCGRSAMKELKSSPNIIDLIEVGDYVNGHWVIDVYTNIFGNKMVQIENVDMHIDIPYKVLNEKDIKSVVTREQIASMEYKIGE